jgi:hypothetical protein
MRRRMKRKILQLWRRRQNDAWLEVGHVNHVLCGLQEWRDVVAVSAWLLRVTMATIGQ